MRFFLQTFILILITNFSGIAQSRWVHSYLDNEDVYLKNILESYDKGYLISGKYGANYSKYNWLIKTDVNGEVLWKKTIGNGLNAIAFHDIDQDESGNIYLGGSTNAYDPDGDPLIMKLNSCGEKEWCSVIYKENHYSFAGCLTITQDGDVAVALFELNEPWVDRICLAKLSAGGELIWKNCFTSADTSQRNEDIYDIILTPDLGFLLTGFCYYEDPEIPDHWIPHPYLLKIDSLGNFQWETVVFNETNMDGGIASSTVQSPNKQYYYSSIAHYHYDSILTSSPSLVKMDLFGNVLEVYDILDGFKAGGKLNYAQFLNDSILAASAGWGDMDDSLWSRAVIIDTLGNLLNSTLLVADLYSSLLDITYDGKLLYASNTYQNGQFDCFLTKLNQDLGQDTIYTMPFTYDSLCPYQIISDTIVQDDCGLIVGVPDDRTIGRYDGKTVGLEVWPNPASDLISISLTSRQSSVLSRQSIERWSIEVYDIFGRKAGEAAASLPRLGEGQGGGAGAWTMDDGRWMMDMSVLPSGLYLLVVKDGASVKASAKFVVAK